MNKILLVLVVTLLLSCSTNNNNVNTPPINQNPISNVEDDLSRFDITFNTPLFDGWDNIESACIESGNNIPVYVKGHYTSLYDAYLDGKKIYKDSLFKDPFTSNNKWFKHEAKSFAVSSDGFILQFSSCN